MALSVYDAVIGSYEDSGGAFAEAWAIAEHQGKADCDKDKLRLYAALLVDAETSNVEGGYLALGGRISGSRLKIINGKPENIPTSLWGSYGWSTWCYTMEDVIKEAIASNSRGPTLEVAEQSSINWLIMELDIQLSKLPYLLMKGYVTTGKERNNINSLRLHGNIPGTWISSLHLAEQWEMTHQTWADIKLSNWRIKTNVFCQECGNKGTTWDAYCAACWAKHMASKRPRVCTNAGEHSAPKPP